MSIKNNILIVLVLSLHSFPAMADSAPSRECQIKAAFLYNFVRFVDWPEDKLGDANEPIRIGIIGKNPFGNAFEPIKDKKLKGRKVIIETFKGLSKIKPSKKNVKTPQHPEIKRIRKCHLLFICTSEKEHLADIIELVRRHGVLTIGQMPGFLESGGIINFLEEEKKIRFEINLKVARKSKLKIRAKLLRLATRIIDETSEKQKGT